MRGVFFIQQQVVPKPRDIGQADLEEMIFPFLGFFLRDHHNIRNDALQVAAELAVREALAQGAAVPRDGGDFLLARSLRPELQLAAIGKAGQPSYPAKATRVGSSFLRVTNSNENRDRIARRNTRAVVAYGDGAGRVIESKRDISPLPVPEHPARARGVNRIGSVLDVLAVNRDRRDIHACREDFEDVLADADDIGVYVCRRTLP